ncbi:hypothetical protein GGTG_10632 [Gaeumannomyces tritici R3-111a-1]|uniref:N-acetyltransferase domain-containing protein n=1 Tax=Gaeumannomyces tritici (strain R3-111a-1) TaxID=644352 RepID=J3PAV7_GAET3|nr:hypothetical protein GGTG_10632 [Gaeumannomyces tritici R3-111a-1]EJT71373.1 hypothetical protein GGTG_10632 [Gaeumannomyces tritici R3-111a-1]
MPLKYTVRRGVPEDLPALWPIAEAAFESDTEAYWTRLWRDAASAEELAAAAGPWWTAWQRREMATPGKHFWVATAAAREDDARDRGEEEIVAFVSWQQPLSEVDPNAGKTDAEKAAEKAAAAAEWPPCMDPSILDVRRAKHAEVMRRELGESWRDMWVTQIMAVHPSHQRKGLATMLMRRVMDKVEESGAGAILVATPEGRKTYNKLGFKDVCGYSLPFDKYDVWLMQWKGSREP